MSKNNWHETQVRIRYKDTDRMGVVYYGNYLTFFEVARAEVMRDLDFSYAKMEEEGYALPAIEAGLRYHGNVGYDSLITIKTRVAYVKKVRVRFEYEVFDPSESLIVKGHTVHACMDKNLKPVRIPSNVKGLLEERFGI